MSRTQMDLLCRTALVGALALGLTACGVKGPLEPPPAASSGPAEPGQTKTAGGASAGPVTYVETSSVQRSRPRSILPQMPPKEWEKEEERKRVPVRPNAEQKPDRPFFLDWLL